MQPIKFTPSLTQADMMKHINGKALEVYIKSLGRVDSPELLVIKWHQAKDEEFIAALSVHTQQILSGIDSIRRLIYCWKRTINENYRELLVNRCLELTVAKGLDSRTIKDLAAMQKQQK